MDCPASAPLPLPRPPKSVWIKRFARRIAELDPGLPLAAAEEEADHLYEQCWGDYAPEQAAAVATGAIDPMQDHHAPIFDGAHGSHADGS